MSTNYYIGLMSGTSTDGVDGVIAAINAESCQVIAHQQLEFKDSFRQELLQLNQPGANELHRSANAANKLVNYYAQLCQKLLQQTQLTAAQITAIGAHGQTIRHCPAPKSSNETPNRSGYSIQINNPALLAELTNICVVADFRSRDIAAGGQGAPLVPAFHQAFCSLPQQDSAVLNLGGIANLSLLYAKQLILGFDSGPANLLMDAWCQQHLHQNYDSHGVWASSGQVNAPLLSHLLADPYFQQSAPKSSGRDYFNLNWLNAKLTGFELKPQDVQATLLELTASSVIQALQRYQPNCRRLLICGGGFYNSALIKRLNYLAQQQFEQLLLQSSAVINIQPLEMEAAAFAWLARQTLEQKTANIPSVTGAQGSRILGAIYPK